MVSLAAVSWGCGSVPAAIASRRTSGRLPPKRRRLRPRCHPRMDYGVAPTPAVPVPRRQAGRSRSRWNAVRRWVGLGKLRQDDSNGNTAKLVVSVGPAGVTITRSQIRTPVSEVTLSGTYDGSAIRASGIETGSARRTCTLALTRDGSRWLASLRPRPLLLPLHSLPYRRSRLPNREPLRWYLCRRSFWGAHDKSDASSNRRQSRIRND